jgi:hypothetical protein
MCHQTRRKFCEPLRIMAKLTRDESPAPPISCNMCVVIGAPFAPVAIA